MSLMIGTAGLPHVITRFFTVPKVKDARSSAGWALVFIAILYTTAPAVGAMARLNRRFGVVVDSDRTNAAYNIPERKLNWKQQCEAEGGLFFITRKRELENYLHKDVLARAGKTMAVFDDFSDMKEIFGDKVYKVIEEMTCDELLSRDAYREGRSEHHEIKEMIAALLALPDTPAKKKGGA